MPERIATLLKDNPAADRAKEELRAYVLAQAERMLVGAGRKLGRSTARLNDVAEGKGLVRGAVGAAASHVKGTTVGALKNLGGTHEGRAGRKPTVILEAVDVGVPVQDAYDQWTTYRDLADFAKGDESATAQDEASSEGNLKIFWSRRSWKAHITEQIPDTTITWTSEGTKGTTKGAVTFHELADHLTRVLLVVEYQPKGLLEKAGNLWRAQERRVRLDLKEYARYTTLKGEAPEGWRGETRDEEVAVAQEDDPESLPEAEAEDDAYEDRLPQDVARDEDEDEDEDEAFADADAADGDAEYDDAEYDDAEYDEEDEAAYDADAVDGRGAYEDEPDPDEGGQDGRGRRSRA
ncbi:SRPBCC family protein [Streptomyces sp. NPDC003038]|uniref:SRPBCC family protein n=1 Tax=unclassified Streptomyces TaxID=2593676 RepID=UPI0033B1B677